MAHYFVESIDVFVEKKCIQYLFGIPNKSESIRANLKIVFIYGG